MTTVTVTYGWGANEQTATPTRAHRRATGAEMVRKVMVMVRRVVKGSTAYRLHPNSLALTHTSESH